MRIVVDYNTQDPSNPCVTFNRGEYIDYTFQVVATAATDEVNAGKEINIYPNPFTDVLHIAEAREVKEVTIFDVAGRMIKKN